jgi:NTE family protein
MARPFSPPDVLVLGAGGVVGEAWLTGMLSGIEDAAGIDLRRVEHLVGTSAGSIVGAHLMAGQRPRRPDEAADRPGRPDNAASRTLARTAGSAAKGATAYVWAAGAPILSLGLAAAAPGGAMMRAAVLGRMPRPSRGMGDLSERIERLGARFDGRLRVCAVNRQSGRRVVFGAPGAPRATVGDAVRASSTVPWLFSPMKIGDEEYVDGAVWSPTNLDVAPAGRGTEVLCLTPTGGAAMPTSVIQALRNAGRTAAEAEAASLRRKGARVRIAGPDKAAAREMGEDYMSPKTAAAALDAGYRQGRQLAGG